jgi:hypothetical protein
MVDDVEAIQTLIDAWETVGKAVNQHLTSDDVFKIDNILQDILGEAISVKETPND